MSNFPSPTCLSLTNFLRSPGFNIYMFPRFSQHLLACILSQYLNSPHLVPHFRVQNIPPASLSIFLHVSSCIFISFQCLGFTTHLSTTFCAHHVSIWNFPFPLCASQFPVLHPVRFICSLPPLTSPPLLTFLLFQYPNFPGINNFLHASCLNI